MNTPPPRQRAIIVDVDGVVSPVHPTTSALPWGDEIVVGDVYGPVLVSPTLCSRLDALAQPPGVNCWWLTSWTTPMRHRMRHFPGRDWPVIADPLTPPTPAGTGWWKLTAVESWLADHPEIHALAWLDDHLRGGRPSAVRRRLLNIERPLMIRPQTAAGLTPQHLRRLTAWSAPPGG